MHLWSFTKKRMATPREAMLLMGLPGVSSGPLVGSAKCALPHQSFLDGLAAAQVQQLNGNGMHVAAMGAWIFYCLSNSMLKEDMVMQITTEPAIFFSDLPVEDDLDQQRLTLEDLVESSTCAHKENRSSWLQEAGAAAAAQRINPTPPRIPGMIGVPGDRDPKKGIGEVRKCPHSGPKMLPRW